ncbi:MAG: hypothetical protein ABWY78_20180 [Microvirga sp.]
MSDELVEEIARNLQAAEYSRRSRVSKFNKEQVEKTADLNLTKASIAISIIKSLRRRRITH